MIAPSRVDDLVRVIGWGLTASPPSSLPDQLQQVDVRQIPPKHCAANNPPITAGEMCTNNPEGSGMCFGDSASAGMRKIGGRWFLVGAASRGLKDDLGLCGGHNPGILTSAWYYLPWIAPTILGPDWASKVAAQPLPAEASKILPRGATEADRQRMQIAYELAG